MPLLAVLWLWRLDLLDDARIAVIDFNRFYVSQGFAVGGYAVDFSKAVWLRMKTDPLWLAGGIGAVVAVGICCDGATPAAARRACGHAGALLQRW